MKQIESLSYKVDKAKQELATKGQFKKITWRKRFGFFPVITIFIIGVAVGGSWLYVYLNADLIYKPETITIVNRVEASTKKEEKEEKTDFDIIANKIYILESSGGKNNYSQCAKIGKVNNIGYGIPGNGKYMCFSSHDEEMEVLNKWIKARKNEGLTDNQLVCYYNTGEIINDCSYLNKFNLL